MKKICIYCEKWASGGIESFLTSVIQWIDIEYFQIDLVSCHIENSIFTEMMKQRGVKFYQLSGNRNRILANRKIFLNLMKIKRYDILYINAFHGAELYYLSLGERVGIPKRIAHAHNSMLKNSKFRELKEIVHTVGKNMYARCGTNLWACSEVAGHFMFPQSVWNKVNTVFNGINIKRFQFTKAKRVNTRNQLGLKKEIVLGNVGRLCQQKNQIFILKVFKDFLEKYPGSKLLLVGDGEDKDRLTKQVYEFGIQQNVLFIGMTNCVEDLLCAMDIFVFPSIFEGLGIAAVEAQATGLPVICSDQVPIEAGLLQNFRRLSLEAGVDQWVQAIESSCSMPIVREECAAKVKKGGYDIQDVSNFIENTFLEGK